ncbi:Crp/Fnr family transcriptional regulator [Methyloligella solikamskensis]|uniref:Crp/Fnr family transcriptional regulator n=1 Tax=Methyloligella solikamskensis TaxID=1177756 RepID=A0ABW3JCE5_9HYPH
MNAPDWGRIPRPIVEQASIIRTRPGQTLANKVDGDEAVYVVRSGALMQSLTLTHALRQITAIFHPGTMVRTASAPSSLARIVAVRAGEILRLRWPVFSELMESNTEICRYFCRVTALEDALKAIHMAALGRFDTQQRVATYLVELAMRSGVRNTAGNPVCEMPLSRAEMADYLGLNADTLSRTMSGLRAKGLIRHEDRNRTVVCQFDALAALTPAAEALTTLLG